MNPDLKYSLRSYEVVVDVFAFLAIVAFCITIIVGAHCPTSRERVREQIMFRDLIVAHVFGEENAWLTNEGFIKCRESDSAFQCYENNVSRMIVFEVCESGEGATTNVTYKARQDGDWAYVIFTGTADSISRETRFSWEWAAGSDGGF